MSSPRQIADRFHDQWLAAHPFDASYYGVPGYEDQAPDASEAAEAAWRGRMEAVVAEARRAQDADLPEADQVTLECVVGLAQQEIAGIDSRAIEYTVTAMPFQGPAVLLAVAARTPLPDAQAANDYLARLRVSATWVDQHADRLRAGAARGRLPVAPLVDQAIGWAEDVMRPTFPEALAAPTPPEDWPGAGAWQEQRDAVATDVVKPAFGRWLEVLRELRPQSRPPERAGLCHLPGGEADYQRAVRSHTTLERTPQELHQTGLDQIEALEERARQLGESLALGDLPAVHQAILGSAGNVSPEEAMEAARRAVRRAEARVADFFPSPLPGPCSVEPMPAVVAASGAAPHYTPPRQDGSRPGTYWFNTHTVTAGTGWDLEGVAFHEAVPGHHLQLSRSQLLSGLPRMQQQRSVTVFSEGWGLYAEQLAEEMGLYTDERSVLGAVTASLMRAARLVVDTGMHALGWGRQQALDFFVSHVPMPPGFLAAEIDRYIMWPGQALAYMTGKLEILAARQRAQQVMGPGFSLAGFHGAVLDNGSLPMPALHQHIDRWAGGAQPE